MKRSIFLESFAESLDVPDGHLSRSSYHPPPALLYWKLEPSKGLPPTHSFRVGLRTLSAPRPAFSWGGGRGTLYYCFLFLGL